jgi:hypothetical protein
VFPTDLLADFLACRLSRNEEHVWRTSEDNLIDAWAIQSRHRVWHPVPTLARSDSAIGSTGGGGGRDDADDQYMRATVVDWRGHTERDLTSAAWWAKGLATAPQHLVFAGIARPGVSKRLYPAGFDGQLRRGGAYG